MSQAPASLSTWARNIAPSPTLAVDAKAKALQAAGEMTSAASPPANPISTPRSHIKARPVSPRSCPAARPSTPPPPASNPSAPGHFAEKYGLDHGMKVAPSAGHRLARRASLSCYSRHSRHVSSPGDERSSSPRRFGSAIPEMAKARRGRPCRFVLADDTTGFRVTPGPARGRDTTPQVAPAHPQLALEPHRRRVHQGGT